MSAVSRRGFVAGSSLLVGALASPMAVAGVLPNVLCLVADRLPGELLGDRELVGASLPTFGQIGRSWLRFDAASSAMLGDGPAWDAIWLGRPGSETGVMRDGQRASRSLPELSSWVSSKSDIEVFAAGRSGLGGRPTSAIQLCGDLGNLPVLRALQGFFRNRPPGRPWFATVGLRGLRELDPWARAQSSKGPPVDLGLAPRQLPGLPTTLRAGLPEAELLRAHSPTPAEWSDAHWQSALWQSARALEDLDGVIDRLLRTLDASLHGANTLVVLTAAQGSPLGRHGRLRPGDLREGSLRVPLAVRCPWTRPAEAIGLPVSTLDLGPTVCAVLGLPDLPEARGIRLRPLLDGHPAPSRPMVFSEGFVEGHSVRSREFRFSSWRDGTSPSLIHLPSDPHEERNLADNPGYSSVVETHRAALSRWIAQLRPTPASQGGWPGDRR